jgi:CRISPR-associated protein (TIGR03986 family)
MIMPISAPYNFVPLSRFVYFPDWADQVSHDAPFEDGISGDLVCELTTKTPVYVRNGGNWDHNDIMTNHEAQSFFNVNGTYMIPGASLKGMLRNVIEIATFGKMSRVDDSRYSVRDLSNPDSTLYKNWFARNVGGNWHPQSKAAWLKKDPTTGELYLEPCQYARVEHTVLHSFYNRITGRMPASPLGRCLSSLDKYRSWNPLPLSVDFTSSGYMNQVAYHPANGRRAARPLHYDRVHTLSTGSRGTIVFTGRGPNKHMEFIFFNPTGNIPVDKYTIFKDFEFIHSKEGDIKKPNDEWKHWKAELNMHGGKVPVFYLMDGPSLHSIGLSQMYKLPYAHTIHDVVKHTSSAHFCDAKPDFAETIFGYVSEGGGHLKGRVSITHATGSNCIPSNTTYQTVLAAPKPTYYPNYLVQPEPIVRYRTYMDPNPTVSPNQQVKAEVRGWKRYPARNEEAVIDPPPPLAGVGTASRTKFTPLQHGATFTFSIKLHNLTPVELGALLWALEWGGGTDCLHSLGMGKAFGFGLCQIAIDLEKSRLFQVKKTEKGDISRNNMHTDTKFVSDTVSTFTDRMKQDIASDWDETPQLVQLLAMANQNTYDVNQQRTKLKQMEIGMGQGKNEFVEAKGNPTRGVPPKALAPHVDYTGRSDAERFNENSASQTQAAPQQSVAQASLADLTQLQAKFKKR